MAVLLAATAAADQLLRDIPIAGTSTTYLDGTWTASTDILSIPATVPGDIVSDLWQAGIIDDPIFEKTWLWNATLWEDHKWTYTTTFSTPSSNSGDTFLLTFDGVKMGAVISLDGVVLGKAVDQFLRYTFPVTLGAPGTHHTLTVAFDFAIDTAGRFMACTGGWDWAPYSHKSVPSVGGSARTLSFGVWKSVYLTLVPTMTAAVMHVSPLTYYTGVYPTSRLTPSTAAPFRVAVNVVLWAPPQGAAGTVEVAGSWGASAHVAVSAPGGESNVTVALTAAGVNLWWPVGLGAQTLYTVNVTFRGARGAVAKTSRTLGFREFAIVTGNDTDPAWVAGAAGKEGSEYHGMYFRVNGVAIWARGANFIPPDQFEGRYTAGAIERMVVSAAEGGMNILRVWGGGVFLPQVFYDACDAAGVLVYHDMMYAQEGHSPSAVSVQADEIRHQVRRLSHHPSIVIWDGCNECVVVVGTDTGIYATFVLANVVAVDTSRSIWPSCPAHGWQSGAYKLTARPTSAAASLIPSPPASWQRDYEFHGPYQHGGGFPAVNGFDDGFHVIYPATLAPQAVGLGVASTFTSEFGASGFSSFESMAATLLPSHWGVHGGEPPDNCSGSWDRTCVGPNPMAERNYPCDTTVAHFFPSVDPTLVGAEAFQAQLWACMAAQALVMQYDITLARAANSMGSMIWQLGENWPTGGWGSLEYSAARPGQVYGGRWKPLHHLLASSLFRDVFVSCGAPSACIVRNDGHAPIAGATLAVDAVAVATGVARRVGAVPVDLAAGPAAAMWVVVDGLRMLVPDKEIVRATLFSSSGNALATNYMPFVTPVNLGYSTPEVTATVANTPDPTDGSVLVTLSAPTPALFVTLTTQAAGRFSDNFFHLIPAGSRDSATGAWAGGPITRGVKFLPWGAANATMLAATLRVEHLAGYVPPSSAI